ncbi:hypothetical protein M0R45_015527 [Rubus argutus]|uniref:Pentatricopeptide repeat-containing protein n=1 Tax=Rubus argutus TaxID=59490 RepID=A0AAW1XTB6_RUBAR
MQMTGIVPDEITYLCLLSACAHGGLVKEAWYFFESIGKHGMTPKSEHYACMVDVLARRGQVEEAYQFICQMPREPTPSMLGALLNGCTNHRKLGLAEIVGRKLIEIQPITMPTINHVLDSEEIYWMLNFIVNEIRSDTNYRDQDYFLHASENQ